MHGERETSADAQRDRGLDRRQPLGVADEVLKELRERTVGRGWNGDKRRRGTGGGSGGGGCVCGGAASAGAAAVSPAATLCAAAAVGETVTVAAPSVRKQASARPRSFMGSS